MIKKKPIIFIVEDDKDVAYLVQDILENQGADCIIETNGEQIVERAIELNPALILLDIKLPGIDGYTVCRRLKRIDKVKDIPVIFISALNTEDDVVEAYHAGGIHYISKPFDLDYLISKVKELLAKELPVKVHGRLNVERQVLYVNAGYTLGTDQFLDPVRRFISNTEFKLITIDNPQDTLRQARQSRPDIILLDVDQSDVPVDTFLDVLIRHQTTKHIPLVVISDLFALQAGAVDSMPNVKAVLSKPVEEKKLLYILRDVAMHGLV
ncbi:response regulator [bacterium]|nr:response regulator [bacterium]